mmetsp:Transcript_16837/g.25284  ORF Transcript_16837/g.25284 Transcript_16837/m.25284 type:complete len:393 (-) Transcript_16837:355-1533(-)
MFMKFRDGMFLVFGFAIGVNIAFHIHTIDTMTGIDFDNMIFDGHGAANANQPLIPPITYVPAKVEQTIMDNLMNWGWNEASRKVHGCDIWTDKSASAGNLHLHELLNAFLRELKDYYKTIQNFQPTVLDALKAIQSNPRGKNEICKALRLHPDGIQALFPSGQLSYTSTSGYVEPLTTPMRHPDFCFDTQDKAALMDMNYLVHDFEAMCRTLKPTSRRILIDMGASLSYHTDTEVKAEIPPIVHLLNMYHKFGFTFDHIYGYEATFTEPSTVFNDLLPKEYMTSYHWINAPVSATKGHKLNPLDSILRQFDKDDFIVIKIDIDTHVIEVPLVHQLLEDDSLNVLVDQFYFEHHVKFKEMSHIWRSAMHGSLKETFDLFHGLRQKGVPAHFWP